MNTWYLFFLKKLSLKTNSSLSYIFHLNNLPGKQSHSEIYSYSLYIFNIRIRYSLILWKLDGVGPVKNRPSTNKLHHFVQKHDTWHVTRDICHVTRDTLGGMNIPSKFQLPRSYCSWFLILYRYGGKGWLT